MRRRPTDFSDLITQLSEDDIRRLQAHLPVCELHGAKYLANDFESVLLQLEAGQRLKLPPKRQLHLHEAILHILAQWPSARNRETRMLDRIRYANELHVRKLYRQALLEYLHAKKLAQQFALTYMLPVINLHIQSTLSYMTNFGDYSRHDLQLIDHDFTENQLQVLKVIEAEMTSFGVAINASWSMRKLTDSSPVAQRIEMIKAYKRLEQVSFDLTQVETISSGYSNYLINLSKLAVFELRFEDAHALCEEHLEIILTRNKPWPMWQAIEIMLVLFRLLHMKAFVCEEAEFLEFANTIEAFALKGGAGSDELYQLSIEINIRSIQFYLLNNRPEKIKVYANHLRQTVDRDKFYTNAHIIDLFEALILINEKSYRLASKTLVNYHEQTQKDKLEVYLAASILQMLCAYQLEDYDALQLHYKYCLNLAKDLMQEPFYVELENRLATDIPVSASALLELISSTSVCYQTNYHCDFLNRLLPMDFLKSTIVVR